MTILGKNRPSMYGLPIDLDFSFLNGRSLELLSFGKYTVTLHFGGDCYIQIESPFEHGSERYNFPLHDSKLMQLLETKVVSAQRIDSQTLALYFENDQVVRCLDSAENYECFQIRLPDGRLIIV